MIFLKLSIVEIFYNSTSFDEHRLLRGNLSKPSLESPAPWAPVASRGSDTGPECLSQPLPGAAHRALCWGQSQRVGRRALRMIAATKRGDAADRGGGGAAGSMSLRAWRPPGATVRLLNAMHSTGLEAALGQSPCCVLASGVARLAKGISQQENLAQRIKEGLTFSRLAVIG